MVTTSEMTCRGVVSMFWSIVVHFAAKFILTPLLTAFQRTDMTSTCHCHEAPDVKIKESIITFLRVVVLPYSTMYYKYKLTAELETDEEWHGSMELSHTVFLSHRMYWFIKNTQVNHSEKGGCSM